MDRLVKYFRTHHLPWSESIADDDLVLISPFTCDSDVVVTIKMDGECLRSTTPIVLSDGSVKPISHLSIGDVVLGYKDGTVIPSTVTNTFFNGCSSDDWLIIKYKDYRNKTKTLQCTKTHKFFVNGQYITADALTTGVKFLYTKRVKRCSSIQRQIIIGKLLGDGAFGAKQHNIIQYSHKMDHKGYADFVNMSLTDLYSKSCVDKNTSNYSGKSLYKSWTTVSMDAKELYHIMVVDNKKVVPRQLIEEITPLSLAIWFMDDGNLNCDNKNPRLVLSVCGFDLESCYNLIDCLNRFGIKSTLTNSTGYNYINISSYSVLDFCNLVVDYVPDVMQYKLPLELRGKEVMPLVDHSSISESIVQEVELISVQHCSSPSLTGKYDIETETHNYFANGILVHNCTSLYPSGHCHARSLDSGYHESRNYVKALWHSKAHLLPPLWRVCGENLYAKHSIHYHDLESYLYVFSIWTEENICLSWDETLLWCDLLELTPVQVIYRGKYDEQAIKQSFIPFKEQHEGYVIRSSESFHYDDSSKNVAKYVRKNHVQSSSHWMFQEVVPNKLINNED